jgi:hypothetical protein
MTNLRARGNEMSVVQSFRNANGNEKNRAKTDNGALVIDRQAEHFLDAFQFALSASF